MTASGRCQRTASALWHLKSFFTIFWARLTHRSHKLLSVMVQEFEWFQGLFQPGCDQPILEPKNFIYGPTPVVLLGLKAKDLVMPLFNLLMQQRSTGTRTPCTMCIPYQHIHRNSRKLLMNSLTSDCYSRMHKTKYIFLSTKKTRHTCTHLMLEPTKDYQICLLVPFSSAKQTSCFLFDPCHWVIFQSNASREHVCSCTLLPA